MKTSYVAYYVIRVRKASRGVVSWIRDEFAPNDKDHATRFDSAKSAEDYCGSLGIADTAVHIVEAPEKPTCHYCDTPLDDLTYVPYCGPQCAQDAENDSHDDQEVSR